MSDGEAFVRDFDVVDEAWSLERIRSYLRQSDSSWVIVRQRARDEQRRFFVLRRDKLVSPLVLESELGILGAEEPAVTVDSGARLQRSSRAQVVMEGTAPIGIVPPRRAQRGGTLNSDSFTLDGRRDLAGLESVSLSSLSVEDSTAPLTRRLAVDLPRSMTIGVEVSLLVSLKALGRTDDLSVPFAKPAGTKVDIVVKSSAGLSIVGRAEGRLEVSEPQLEQPIQFKLRGEQLGTGEVRVFAFSDGACLAMLPLSVSITTETAAPIAPVDREVGVTIEPSPRTPPDLSLLILESGSELSFRLSSANGEYYLQDFGSVQLQSDPRAYFSGFFASIQNLPVDTPAQRRTAAERLASKGANLFQAVLPKELRVLLWDLRDRITTVQITSDDPWIPWEVCRLTGETNGQAEDGPFFAEAFQVTRWLAGAALASSLRLRNIALVVPGDSRLPQAEVERDFLLSLATNTRAVTEVAATYDQVREQMASVGYDAWHFTGHARGNLAGDANLSAILLANQEELCPEDIVGRVENMLAPRPFIFLNACQSAQGGLSLTGPGGWARRFLSTRAPKRTASGFIGSYWSVYDNAAVEFAKTFYTELLHGKSVGEAGKAARLAIRSNGDPTWLAYTIYADPNAKVAA